MLARLRFRDERSRGRRCPQPPHPYRGEYQRDRDRIIHSRAFRRLEHKTQVFTVPDSDHLRNRLTHTIEVSQIARTVAKALGLNEELVEALALSHDVGHPPFGHAGEDALDTEMRKYGSRFDHNLHALRIVEHFEHRYPAFEGLNLTFEVREGIVKHSRDYRADEFPQLSEYLLGEYPPLEAQLIDLADEVTYNCADLDDAVEAGLLDAARVRNEVGLFDRFLSRAEAEFPDASPKLKFNEALRELLGAFVSGLIEGTRDAAEQAGVISMDAVRAHSERLARLRPEPAAASRELRALLSREVYNSPRLAAERHRTGTKLTALFRFFMERPQDLPAGYGEQAQVVPVHQIVCDYLAGMTDKFLLRRHGELIG